MSNNLISSKYTFVCDPDECDCLIELTSSDGFGFPSGVMELTCPCGRKTTLLSVEHATIPPINQTKEEPMLDNLEASIDAKPAVPETYNSNLLVTYKQIHGYSDPEYVTDKVVNLEWELHNGRQSQKRVGVLESKIHTVRDILLESFADSEDQDTLTSIAEALDIELTRDVEFTATIEVSGTITLNLLEDYDLESEIQDTLYVDAQNGNVQIDGQDVTHVMEC